MAKFTSSCNLKKLKIVLYFSGGDHNLSEQFQEVVDVGGAHGLGDVALVLEVVLAGVGSAHPQSMEGADLQPAAITLK